MKGEWKGAKSFLIQFLSSLQYRGFEGSKILPIPFLLPFNIEI